MKENERKKFKQELINNYKTGKYGNWTKPGLRLFIRENSTEYQWRRVKNNAKIPNLTLNDKAILGI